MQQLQGLFYLREQVAVDLILITQVVISDKETYLYKSAWYKTFGLCAKQQCGSALQVVTFLQLQAGQQSRVAVF